ncbi:hypothetical protein DIPPA_35762 [Diplonema papillatum]|nr:hypothetical protein DIPPA_35762 [Diplonema papillatum]
MAALPAWKQPEDEERKGSYTFGVVLNPGGGLAGEISDFRCGKGAGGRWFRGGRSELRAAAECGLRETTGNAFYERPTAWGRTGVSVTVWRKPVRDAGKAGWPVFGRRRVETSTEGQLYCAPKAREGLLRAVYLRVKSSGLLAGSETVYDSVTRPSLGTSA